MASNINVNSEIGRLRKVMVHTPDGGIGNVPANKLHDWLYDDIVDLEKTQNEYFRFFVLLNIFCGSQFLFDTEGRFKIRMKKGIPISKKDPTSKKRLFEINPEKGDDYFAAGLSPDDIPVLDTQYVLQWLCQKYPERAKDLIEAICASEGTHATRKHDLKMMVDKGKYVDVVKTLLTGKLEYQARDEELDLLVGEEARYIFPPIPNFIFTRDIGVTIGDRILITKPRFYIRKREVLLMRFIAENWICKNEESKILNISEDDDFFQLSQEEQSEKKVNYEGGDIMVISKNHILIGCSERTSPYAIEKLVNRLFLENINTGENGELDTITAIKISEKRSQMHIDTVISHLAEGYWAIHSPLSEVWDSIEKSKHWVSTDYTNQLSLKSENQKSKEKLTTIFQFHLNAEAKAIKRRYHEKYRAIRVLQKEFDQEKIDAKREEIAERIGRLVSEKNGVKGEFRKCNFLLEPDMNGVKDEMGRYPYRNHASLDFTHQPRGLHDLLAMISQAEFGADEKKAYEYALYSGGGNTPHDSREQWTDACNLLILKPGVAVGYDRNTKTAEAFEELMKNSMGKTGTTDPTFEEFCSSGINRFKKYRWKHVIHVDDLIEFIARREITREALDQMVDALSDTLILLPSNELARARGGSHCMTLPLIRDSF